VSAFIAVQFGSRLLRRRYDNVTATRRYADHGAARRYENEPASRSH
jgi:hypothetical protein